MGQPCPAEVTLGYVCPARLRGTFSHRHAHTLYGMLLVDVTVFVAENRARNSGFSWGMKGGHLAGRGPWARIPNR